MLENLNDKLNDNICFVPESNPEFPRNWVRLAIFFSSVGRSGVLPPIPVLLSSIAEILFRYSRTQSEQLPERVPAENKN